MADTTHTAPGGAADPDGSADPATGTKRAVRALLLDRRAAVDDAERARRDAAIRAHLVAEVLPGREAVCAFVPWGAEPGGADLPEWLTGRGHRVWLPVSGAGGAMSWARYREPGDLAPGRFGIPAPVGGEQVAHPAIDLDVDLDLVLAPALGADRDGNRLGRGGGYYDRFLSALPAAVPVVALLDDDAVLDAVPVEPHDAGLDAVVTPSGVRVVPGREASRAPRAR